MPDTPETHDAGSLFNPGAYPPDTLFHERRSGHDRRADAPSRTPKADRRTRPERRRRVDPTTFEKQYSPDEMEFMNAMQEFKMRSGKAFPSYGDVLHVARGLGYAKADEEPIA
jgi:hypothetical protein